MWLKHLRILADDLAAEMSKEVGHELLDLKSVCGVTNIEAIDVAVRGTMRATFSYPHPAAIAKVTLAA